MILVTGANSLLGTNVVLELLANNEKVRCLVRHSNVVIDQTDLFLGDVVDEKQLRRAMQGCSAVIHIAAITAQDLLSIDNYRFNWECAALVARCAREVGLDRMIFVSSANSVGNGTLQNPASEDQPLLSPYADSLYAQSKVRAEQQVLKEFQRAIVVNPGFMIGAYDSKPSSGEIITRALGRSVVFAPSGGKSFVHVKDVARAVVNAIDRGKCGERYLATGVSMSVRDFYKLMQNVTGTRFRIFIVPSFILIGVGYIGDLIRKMGIRTPISSGNMKILCQREYYDNSRAVQELEMPQREIAEAIREAIEWFDNNGTKRFLSSVK